MATVTVRKGDGITTLLAKSTVVHISASGVDNVDETDNSEIRYYISAECAGQDSARTPVFAGDFTWDGWVAPAAGSWTFHLRKVSDDSSVANSGAQVFA